MNRAVKLMALIMLAPVWNAANAAEINSQKDKVVSISQQFLTQHRQASGLPTSDNLKIYRALSNRDYKLSADLIKTGDYDPRFKNIYTLHLDALTSPSSQEHSLNELVTCASNDIPDIAHLCSIVLAQLYIAKGNRIKSSEWAIASADLVNKIDYGTDSYRYARFLTAEWIFISYAYDRNIEKAVEASSEFLSTIETLDLNYPPYATINNLILLLEKQEGPALALEALMEINIDPATLGPIEREIALYTAASISIKAEKYVAAIPHLKNLIDDASNPAIRKSSYAQYALALAETGNFSTSEKILQQIEIEYPGSYTGVSQINLLRAHALLQINNNEMHAALNTKTKIQSLSDEIYKSDISAQRQRVSSGLLISNEKLLSEQERLRLDIQLQKQKTRTNSLIIGGLLGLLSLLTIGTFLLQRSKRKVETLNDKLEANNDELSLAHGDLENANINLKTALDSAIAAKRAKEQFIGVVGHELRTPLNPIINLSKILSDKFAGTTNGDFANAISMAGKRLHLAIENMICISDAASNPSIYIEQANPVNIYQNIVEEYNDIIADKYRQGSKNATGTPQYIKFTAGKSKDFPTTIPTSTIALTSILTNILDNSIKFTKTGKIEASFTTTEVDYIITIKDTGCGFAIGELEKYKQAFFQPDMSFTRKHEGAGLGLTVADVHVRRIKGNLTFESIEGLGTTVVIALPKSLPVTSTGVILAA